MEAVNVLLPFCPQEKTGLECLEEGTALMNTSTKETSMDFSVL